MRGKWDNACKVPKRAWCLVKCPIWAILNIVRKGFGIAYSRRYTAVSRPVSITDSLVGCVSSHLRTSFHTINAIFADVCTAEWWPGKLRSDASLVRNTIYNHPISAETGIMGLIQSNSVGKVLHLPTNEVSSGKGEQVFQTTSASNSKIGFSQALERRGRKITFIEHLPDGSKHVAALSYELSIGKTFSSPSYK